MFCLTLRQTMPWCNPFTRVLFRYPIHHNKICHRRIYQNIPCCTTAPALTKEDEKGTDRCSHGKWEEKPYVVSAPNYPIYRQYINLLVVATKQKLERRALAVVAMIETQIMPPRPYYFISTYNIYYFVAVIVKEGLQQMHVEEEREERLKRYQKEYHKRYYEKHKEELKEYSKNYNEEHKAELKEYHKRYQKKYYKEHKEKLIKYSKKHYEENKEDHKEYFKKYNEEHKEECYTRTREWQRNNRERYNEKMKKVIHKRKRNLGYVPLNKPFKNSEGHHIDKKRVIYLPKELHRSIRHSLTRNRNMYEINCIAWDFLKQELGIGWKDSNRVDNKTSKPKLCQTILCDTPLKAAL